MPLDFDFIKSRYDYELQRKEQLTGSLSLPAGALGGLGGLLALMARSFTYRDPVLTWAFAPFLGAAIASFFACLVQLGRAYHHQTYRYIPLLSALVDWEDENRAWLDKVDLRSHLRLRIIEAADNNTANNDERAYFLYWSRVWLFMLLGFTAFAGISYVADQVRYSDGRTRNEAIAATAAAECHATSANAVSA